ncbi:hypothetical protein [Gimesia panareensis]|uniref:Uncharacterized protein n=1 Tax=Gimesia panareensis TaxID=2527978 RepID=A0A517QD95_9PLAN|nr:hypothetical protein [Gimesia panareensis]QDT29603.1 hypothetical protein Enr10x_49580 [Gimesia panareensis]QDU52647.1 hypothetical protein Pan110_50270 [Gimesia panareensis]
MKNVFVLEERTHIVSELRWQFEGQTEWSITGFSSEQALFQQATQENSDSLLAILDFSAGKTVCLQFLQRYQGAHSRFPVMVFSPDPLQNLEWALRELGVFHIQSGELEPERIAKICRWQLVPDPQKRQTHLLTTCFTTPHPEEPKGEQGA